MNRTELLKIAKPILFNTEMVRAILDGRKTVTRRVVPEKVMDAYYDYDEWCESVMPRDIPCTRNYERDFLLTMARYKEEEVIPCEPDDKHKHLFEYKQENEVWVAPADYLYVRETFCSAYDGEAYFYFADKYTKRQQKQMLDYDDVRWKPSIHMPKEAARIFLKVTGVRVERLQDITDDGVIAEGTKDGEKYITKEPTRGDRDIDISIENWHIACFCEVWQNTLNKKNINRCCWGNNPWVWVYEFERVEPDV